MPAGTTWRNRECVHNSAGLSPAALRTPPHSSRLRVHIKPYAGFLLSLFPALSSRPAPSFTFQRVRAVQYGPHREIALYVRLLCRIRRTILSWTREYLMRIDDAIVNSGRLRESPVNQSNRCEIRWLFIVDAGLMLEAFSLILFFHGER